MCQIVNSLDPHTTKFHQTLDLLNDYLEQTKAPMPLREQLRNYFYHNRNLYQEKTLKTLLRLMSPGLRNQVTLHSNSWLTDIKFFHCPNPVERSDFTMELTSILIPACFIPNEYVIRGGEYNTKM